MVDFNNPAAVYVVSRDTAHACAIGKNVAGLSFLPAVVGKVGER